MVYKDYLPILTRAMILEMIKRASGQQMYIKKFNDCGENKPIPLPL